MPQYLVAGYLPDDFDPSQVDEAVGREIHALNKEMIAAGVRLACRRQLAHVLRGLYSFPADPRPLTIRSQLTLDHQWNVAARSPPKHHCDGAPTPRRSATR